VLETLRQALGTLGGLILEPGAHGAGDGQELGLDPAADPAGTTLELLLQARDRPLQAHDGVTLTRLPPLPEVDDLTHAAIVEPRSDITSEPPGADLTLRLSAQPRTADASIPAPHPR
jgi:hypothetical protein